MPSPRIADALLVDQDRIFVFLVGDLDQPIRVFDIQSGSWSAPAQTDQPLSVIGDGTTFVQGRDGFLYQFGPPRIYRYDSGANRWDAEPIATIQDSYVTGAVVLEDGSILLVSPGVGATTCLRLFDPASGNVAPVRCESGRYWNLATTADRNVVAFGQDGVVRLGLAADTWLASDPPPVDLFSAGMGLGPDGLIYAFGGPGPSAVAFDLARGVWLSVPSPKIAPYPTEVVAGPDGRLYVMGGQVKPDGPPLWGLSVEVFDPD